MIAGGLIELVLGVNAERKSLETIAKPLTAVSEYATAQRCDMAERLVESATLTAPGLR